MALRDMLNIVSGVSVIKTIYSNDGMGGQTSATTTTVLSLAALWTGGKNNKFVSDKYAKDSTDTLCLEYGTYSFNDISSLTSSQSMIEQVSYNGNTYKTVGFADNVMQLNEIIVQQLERIS